ncbi:MAG: PAS domain-containing sensor histidine kinase [Ruminococcaceae bacterium]|nr:PAS domain-containing sensor histidine kinase [Oscillospiraceae bacterium]
MTRRIFGSICLVALAVLISVISLLMGLLYRYFNRLEHQQLRNQTALAARAVEEQGLTYLQGLDMTNCRVTWIDKDGTVLYDTDTDSTQMENHLERQEVQQALSLGYGESARYSDTLMEQSLYAAQKLEDGTVVRLSILQSSVLNLVLGMLKPVCFVLLAAMALALLLALRLSKRIVKPLNDLNLEEPLSGKGYQELSPLLRRMDSQQKQLRQQRRELNRQKEEFQTVTANMTEGLVLLNRRGIILSINPAASALLGIGNAAGQDIFAVNCAVEIREMVTHAIQAQRAEKTISLRDGAYQVDANPVMSEGLVTGVVLLLFDVTEKRDGEIMRREFTANVSHELKTPLHAISGYAELLSHGLVQAEDVPAFSGKIYTEAQRMIKLVEDIIRLSRLDEGAEDMSWEQIDLLELAQETVRNFAITGKTAQVELEVSGAAVSIYGIRQLLSTILSNLCSNAIKYNRPGGSVRIQVSDEEHQALVTVTDTGIGIPPEHQSRVFERFYRVDKSHSKAVGGTGLGLSIVKHAAAIHRAKIELTSAPEQGTTVTVIFPKEAETKG